MTYLAPDSNYSEFWVIEGTQVPPNLTFVIKDSNVNIFYDVDIKDDETTAQYIDRVLAEFAETSNLKFQDLNLKFNDEFNKSFYVATDYANQKIQFLSTVFALVDSDIQAKFAMIESSLAKANLTDTNASQILNEYITDESSQYVRDTISTTIHALQNDANGNYYELKFPIVTHNNQQVVLSDLHADFIKAIVSSECRAEVSSIVKTVDSLKIYFVTNGVHLKPFDYKINDIRYGKILKIDLEIYRKKAGA